MSLRDLIERGGGPTPARLELSAEPDPLVTLASTVAMDVGQVRSDLASAVENIRHLPTKLWLFLMLLAATAGSGAIVALLIRYLPPA